MMRGRGRQKITEAKLRKSENKQKKKDEFQIKQFKQTLPVMKKSKRARSSKFNSFRQQFKKVVQNIKNSESPNNPLYDFELPFNHHSKDRNQCEDKDKDKRQLQVNFIMRVKNIYDLVTGNTKMNEEEKQSIQLGQQVVYFLGSALQRVKDKDNSPISFLEYLEQCIKIFRKSSKPDIIEFLSLPKQLRRQEKQIATEERTQLNRILKDKTSTSINTHINKIVLKIQKGDHVARDKENILLVKEDKVTNSSFNKENIMKLQESQQMYKLKTQKTCQQIIYATKTNNQTIQFEEKQSQSEAGVSKYRQIQLKFCKSVQTQQNLIQQTPSKCRKKSQTSCLSTPIRKIQSSKNQRCLNQSNSNKQENLKKQSPAAILDQNGLLENNQKHKQQVKNLNGSLGESNLQVKLNNSNILTSYLQQKYSYFPKQNIKEKRLGFGRCGLDETWRCQLKSTKTPENLNREHKATNDDDRIDRLAAKVQKHIESNLRMIERSKEARDLY